MAGTLDAGRWTLDAGRWTLDAGRWTLDAGRWTLDAGRFLASPVSRQAQRAFLLQASSFQLPAPNAASVCSANAPSQPSQQLPHFRQVPAADRYPLRMATQYQLMAAGGQGFQPFDAIQRHQRAAMGADKAGGEFFFQLFQRFVDQGFTLIMHHGDVFLVGLTVQNVIQRYQLQAM